ncbi:MAG: hypothetical protein ABIE84_00130, partial [bacterium]
MAAIIGVAPQSWPALAPARAREIKQRLPQIIQAALGGGIADLDNFLPRLEVSEKRLGKTVTRQVTFSEFLSVPQDHPNHRFDILGHTLAMVRWFQADPAIGNQATPAVLLAALLHDIGKPQTKAKPMPAKVAVEQWHGLPKPGQVAQKLGSRLRAYLRPETFEVFDGEKTEKRVKHQFLGHEKEGVPAATAVAKALGLSATEVDQIACLVELHTSIVMLLSSMVGHNVALSQQPTTKEKTSITKAKGKAITKFVAEMVPELEKAGVSIDVALAFGRADILAAQGEG